MFGLQVAERRWVALAAGLFVMACGGTMYAFPIYSDALKSAFDLSQSEEQAVQSCSTFGLALGAVSGGVFDRWGPRVTARIGGVLILAGYVGMSLAVSGWGGPVDAVSGETPVEDVPDRAKGKAPILALLTLMWSTGSVWCDMGALGSAIRNFPEDRGLVVGLLKSFFGLSAGIMSVMYLAFFKSRDDVSGFLLFLGVAGATVGFTSAFFIVLVPPEQSTRLDPRGRQRLYKAFILVFVLGAYLTSTGLVQHHWIRDQTFREHLLLSVFIAGGTLGLLAAFTLLAFRRPPSQRHDNGGVELQRLADEDALAGSTSSSEVRPVSESASSRPPSLPRLHSSPSPTTVGSQPPEESVPTRTAVRTLRLWLLFGGFSLGIGVGLNFIANIAQISESRMSRKDSEVVFVTLFSVTNCVGRAGVGFLSDRLASRMSRISIFIVMFLLMAFGQALVALSGATWALYASSISIGLSFGSFWCLMPTMVFEMFGPASFGGIYAFISAGPPMVLFLLSVQMTSRLYDDQLKEGERVCDGVSCFRTAFIVTTGLSLFAMSLMAALRTLLRRGNRFGFASPAHAHRPLPDEDHVGLVASAPKSDPEETSSAPHSTSRI